MHQSFNSRLVRSLALLEENSSFVSELIPSWHAPPQADASQPAPEGDENERSTKTNKDLVDLRKALRDLGGKKVQRESKYTTLAWTAPVQRSRNVRCPILRVPRPAFYGLVNFNCTRACAAHADLAYICSRQRCASKSGCMRMHYQCGSGTSGTLLLAVYT
jgi:hypothetical protein